MARLKEKYLGLKSELQADLGIQNPMQTPALEKVIISVGAGFAMKDNKLIQNIEDTITKIAGQKASTVIAKKSVAGFKVREGMPVGVRVTLRGENMYNFFDRLVAIALPRVKDFRGVPRNGFDGRGNYNFGLQEQLIFPEISYDSIMQIHGMNITVVTSADSDKAGFALLEKMGMPFTKGSTNG
ncbi:MAG: 50S ribosomal protein L5 [Sulfurimonas sp.]|uniref:50S ribosomal protein L5 n=1 Tax=Sulfurimonas sp. TaxID=2022749 RepID=UPI00262023A5|nr:50S ribosomal protein L5 [Sulfurimonas sp.]MCW8838340.1 50S ribosomal protein L5 [Sulfurimonadaceae bacterium]MCW8894197.1 50S ribosomal protein L5 [Sulfurimonas sp.]MCW8954208.1 50S ribosomal protein L5 [Sulfurimonas sp.]MCW9067281.1 50S ribosomal protein L5 [Sulfurimonas sp.]